MASSLFRHTPRLTLSDMIDKGGVSQLVADDFFETGTGPTYDGVLRRWNGASWVKAKLRRWTGAVWADAVLKFWDGSQWGLVDTTGV